MSKKSIIICCIVTVLISVASYFVGYSMGQQSHILLGNNAKVVFKDGSSLKNVEIEPKELSIIKEEDTEVIIMPVESLKLKFSQLVELKSAEITIPCEIIDDGARLKLLSKPNLVKISR